MKDEELKLEEIESSDTPGDKEGIDATVVYYESIKRELKIRPI